MIYNIHGFAEIIIHTNVDAYLRYFDNEYKRISALCSSSKNIARTRITVHIVEQLPKTQPGDLHRTCRLKKIFKFHFLVRGIASDDVHIYFRRHRVDRVYATAVGVYLQGQVLEPVLYAKLIQRGVLLMHAAGVSDGKHGYLFPAHGGTGKTTLSLKLARVGFSLLGDDLVLVDPSAKLAYPFPRPLHLFSYNLRQMKDMNLPWRLRAVIRFKDVLRFFLEVFLREEFLISTRAHLDQLFPAINFGTVVPYRRIMFLTTARQEEEVDLLREDVRNEMTEMILASADLNESLYQNILDDGPEALAIQALERRVVATVLSSVSRISLLNPRSLDDSGVESLSVKMTS